MYDFSDSNFSTLDLKLKRFRMSIFSSSHMTALSSRFYSSKQHLHTKIFRTQTLIDRLLCKFISWPGHVPTRLIRQVRHQIRVHHNSIISEFSHQCLDHPLNCACLQVNSYFGIYFFLIILELAESQSVHQPNNS